MQIVLWLAFGALVGWLASLVMKTSLTMLTNIILGIVGALVGGFLAGLIGIRAAGGMFAWNLGNILISVGGACVVVWLVGKLKK